MSTSLVHDVAISVAAPDQLFNAPPTNPFSERDVDVLGVSGLELIVRRMQADERQDWKDGRLLIQLPPEHVEPGLDRKIRDAIHRYGRAKIQDNLLAIRLMRRRSSGGLGILVSIVLAAILLAYVLFTSVFPEAPPFVQFIVAGAISLFSWVTLWDVLEALLFNPIPLRRENLALRKILDLDIALVAEMPTIGTMHNGRSTPTP